MAWKLIMQKAVLHVLEKSASCSLMRAIVNKFRVPLMSPQSRKMNDRDVLVFGVKL